MSTDVKSGELYLLSIKTLPQPGGVDVRVLIHAIRVRLHSSPDGVDIIHAFKVTGESKVISVVEVTNNAKLERVVESIERLGSISVDCQPLVPYERYVKRLNIAQEVTKSVNKLGSDSPIYWIEVAVGQNGKTHEEFVTICTKEALAVLVPRSQGELTYALFKVVTEVKVHCFINMPSSEQLDDWFSQLPINVDNGANVKVKSRAMQKLDDYIASTSAA